MRTTVADKIAEWLYEKGITAAFGIVGGGNLPLWEAVTRLGKTKIVCVHHEQAAAMASGYFNRIRGGIASVVLVTTGGGSSNALTGVLAAHMDRVPLIVISGNEASRYMHSPTRVKGVQGYDSCWMAMAGTKHRYRLMTPQRWLTTLGDALRIVLEAPHGAVWVDIPKDIQGAVL